MANRTNYLLEILAWQNAFNPRKKHEHMAKKPKQFLPPFMVNADETKKLNKDSVVHTVDDIKAILDKPRG